MKSTAYIVLLTILLAATFPCAAQNPSMDTLAARMRIFADRAGETSVYIRPDKDIYLTGEDLWFSAFVLDAQQLTLSEADQILYVQLTQQDKDSVVWKEMYPIGKGMANGHVYLPDNLDEGVYLLKAYSAHSYFNRPVFYAVAAIQVVKEAQSIKRQGQLAKAKELPADIPFVHSPGASMEVVRNDGDSLAVRLTGNHAQQLFLRVQTRGMLQAIAGVQLKDSLVVKLSVADMPRGIAVITLFNTKLQPLSSGLVFLHEGRKLNIQFSGVKDVYAPKDEVTVSIKTTDSEGKPVPAVLSLRVIDQLFADRRDVRDIVNYYHMSTQVDRPLADPSAKADTVLGSVLVHHYNWYEGNSSVHKPILPDSLQGSLSPLKKTKETNPLSLMLFNYNKSITRFATTDNNSRFTIAPENLDLGRRFFIKYFAEKEYSIRITNPFDTIQALEKQQQPVYILSQRELVAEDKPAGPGLLQYGKMLKAVEIQSKGRAYGDKYLGYLDSIAKFEGNTDFVGQCGGLNCPACGSGTKPVEGVEYFELTAAKRNEVIRHPFSFKEGDFRKVTYQYPKYTEEELMKKFKMAMASGFYTGRTFQSPDYTKDDKALPDNRTTLYWNPVIITNEKGEAIIRFYCSDIRAGFIGVAEGVGGTGDLGTGTFRFSVTGDH